MSLFICGDGHGKYNELIKICSKHRPIVLLGDVGFVYSFLDKFDSSETYILGGNHDAYPRLTKLPHYLGDFGSKEIGGISFFFIRGAYSIDKQYRIEDVDWWREEELNYDQAINCIQEYTVAKPDIVLAHNCPQSIEDEIFKYPINYPNQTQKLLDELLLIHKPQEYYFGHHHKSVEKMINGTRFVCLDELEVKEVKK